MESMAVTRFTALINRHFVVGIKVHIDVDGCVESKSLRCLYRILFM